MSVRDKEERRRRRGDLARSHVGRPLDEWCTQDLTALWYGSWDLTAIDQGYRDFVAAHAPVADAAERARPEPARASTTYVCVLDQWRTLPFRGPGLPAEVLGPDWHGPAATAVFERRVATLEEPALEHARAHWPS